MPKIACLFLMVLSIATFSIAFSNESSEYEIKGDIILCGNARFQFLDQVITRLEYSSNKNFVDAPTAIVTNRNLHGKPPYAEEKDGWLIVSAYKMKLRYRINSGKFTNENLHITWRTSRIEHTWSLGDSDFTNLGGIISSLDGASKKKPPRFRPGILSKDGYCVLDDSQTPYWNDAAKWINQRPDAAGQDLYFFLYEDNYRLAFNEYAGLCGNIPMIPRYTLGAWITDLNYEYIPGTEYVEKYKYSDEDLKRIVTRFRKENIPLDVFVLDFAWHNFGWKGGYDWSPIFPNPKEFLDWSHSNGIKISLNDHPGYGDEGVLSDDDSHAAEIRRQLNLTPPPRPEFFLDITKDWKFEIDSTNIGQKNNWYDTKLADSAWRTFQAASLWEDQGYPEYDGIGWYRKLVSVPKDIPHPLYLLFGGVDDEYDLYINGEEIAHYGIPGNSVYNSLTSTDVSGIVKPGKDNLIVLRVNDWGGGGGIGSGPVALSDQLPSSGIRFNLADKHQAEVFMNVLHHPLIDQGVDFWWIDGGRGSCQMPGLNAQMWTNHVYYEFTQEHTNKRGFVFSRYGGWGNHRYPGLFTGDTYSDWEVLAQEVPYTANGGNALIPYTTHDIGGFLGDTISFDLYARWLQFGAFSPFLRLHSAFENPKDGNVRMPWMYGKDGVDLAKKYFQLRYQLIPYIYTLCRATADSSLPIVRPLYLEYSKLEKAYSSPSEYMFGTEILVAPITDSTGVRDIYLPPGEWIDYFNGRLYKGDRTIRQAYSIMDMPVFVKAGAIIPGAPQMAYSDQRPLDTLVIDLFGVGKGSFDLYEDDGISLNYKNGEYAWTTLSHEKAIGGGEQIIISPANGSYENMPSERAYIIKLHGLPQPSSARVNARSLPTKNITWDKKNSVATVYVPKSSVLDAVRVVIK
jgi:alpha-glucosidase (family GH31 glycosyl hydrolase)